MATLYLLAGHSLVVDDDRLDAIERIQEETRDPNRKPQPIDFNVSRSGSARQTITLLHPELVIAVQD